LDFDTHYEIHCEGTADDEKLSRKEFGRLRHTERSLSDPKVVTLLTEVFDAGT
jgi:hypothetical protein